MAATFTNPLVNMAGRAIGKKPNLREAGLMESAVNTIATAIDIGTLGLGTATGGTAALRGTVGASKGGRFATSLRNLISGTKPAQGIQGLKMLLNKNKVPDAIRGEILPAVIQRPFNIKTEKVSGRSVLPKDFDPYSFHPDMSSQFITQAKGGYIHDILGEKVGFGLSDDLLKNVPGLRGVQNIPLNPLDITGTSKIGQDAVGTVKGWLEAHAGYASRGGDVNDTYVSALLYAASVKKNLQAQLEYVGLMLEGRKATAMKAAQLNTPEIISEGNLLAIQKNYRMKDLSFDKLMAVHETSYPFEINEIGDAILRPTSDYMKIMTDDGKEMFRDTVHFALNHVVKPIANRPSVPRETGRLIAIKLKDLIDANPMAVENIMGVDTYLTPRPGEGIKFPAGKYEILDYNNLPIQGYAGAQEQTLNEIFGRLQGLDMREYIPGMSMEESMENGWRTIIHKLRLEPDPGGHGLDDAVQTGAVWNAISGFRQLQEYYIRMGRHFDDNVVGTYALAKNFTKGQMPGLRNDPYGFEYLLNSFGEASPNAFARIVGRDPFMQAGTMPMENSALNARIARIMKRIQGDYFKQNQMGPIPLPGPKFKEGGYLPGMPSTAIPSTLHGGEYVINSKSVQQLGLPFLNAMNSITGSRFRTPSSSVNMPSTGGSNQISNINIQVENFIGEEEWFKSMMKSYNVNVAPKNRKLAGVESRTFTSYSGINQGM
jgi:hypothetical protein